MKPISKPSVAADRIIYFGVRLCGMIFAFSMLQVALTFVR